MERTVLPKRKERGSPSLAATGSLARVQKGQDHGTVGNFSPKAQAWMTALARAKVDQIVVYRHKAGTLSVATVAGGTWTEKPYRLTIVGDAPCALTCSCPAGSTGRLCKHVACGTFTRKHHVYACKPAPVPVSFDHAYELPPSILRVREGMR